MAEGGTQRLDADPGVTRVSDQIEGPGKGTEERDVENLQDDQQRERRTEDPARMRRGMVGRTAASAMSTSPSIGTLRNAVTVRYCA